LPGKLDQMTQLESRMAAADFWQNQETAQATIQQFKLVKAVVGPWQSLAGEMDDAETLFQLADEEQDEAAQHEAQQALAAVSQKLDKLELDALLSGEHDAGNCFLSVHAGAGGTESCDWVAMLFRMYSRWMEVRGYNCAVVDSLAGDEAGFRSITALVKGPFAYGYLQCEVGVHRLVRISPFDSNARRHTSFAAVDVIPEIDEVEEVDIRDEDLRTDYYRSSGAGGQHVNKTDSAVRITHLPTGIVVACQNERSQHSNRRTAMKMLRARLLRLREKEQRAEIAKLYGDKGEIAWGNQIRSYVLQPYTMVKDHRTDEQTGNVNAVLDGAIDRFIEAALRKRVSHH